MQAKPLDLDVTDVEARPVLELRPTLIPALEPIGLHPYEVNLIRVLNPFDPRDQERSVVTWHDGMTLADLMPVGLSSEYVVSLNGQVLEAHDWAITYVSPGDAVVHCPEVQGGSGRQILAIVAMLAVSIVAPWAAGAMAGSMGLGAVGTAMLTAGLTFAGSMLVHSIFAPSKPSAENRQLSGVSAESSPTYGIDGAKNTSIEGIAVPVNYGTFRMAGNIIGLHTENVGDTQDLYVLLNAGEGPIQGVSDIRLNGNPYTDYPNTSVEVRLGQNSQGTIPWFNSTVTPFNLGTKLASDGSWTPYTTASEVDRIRVDLVAPSGMFNTNKATGELAPFSVPIFVEVARKDTGVWTPVARSDGGASEFNGKQRNQMRLSWDTGRLSVSGEYDVRICRGTFEGGATSATAPKNDFISDQIFVADINEILMDPFTYPNTALVAIKVRLGEQLSGMPQITFLNHGKIVNVWTGAAWQQTNSRNPAWIVWDMLTNGLYGAGMASSRLDLGSFKRWADHCDAEGLTWNGPLDVETNVWDASQYVLRVGRAQLVNIGTRWSVVVERAQTPSMMFSVANMVRGSYRESWLPMNDRANEVDVTYFDKDDDYKRRTLKVYDPAALAAGQAPKSASITLYGVDSYDRAYKEGMFMLNLNRYVLKTVSFRAPTEAITCTVGDLIYVQHDMPHWSDAGRIAASPIA